MAVGILVDCFFYELGHGHFVQSFFSTISYHFEKEGGGSKYPLLMNALYGEELKGEDVSIVMESLTEIKQELSKMSPEQVIWDFNDLSQRPPWGNKLSSKVTNLENYFSTTDGKTFIDKIRIAIEVAEENKCDL
ncbi:immunity 70 family protein [Metabacillus malikii]|uniref:Immunity protein 70 n=1 Tax=Metabacillus malikii TaxID=1504265 RepID=A0ABT9ZMB0_9BACI|nr:immunity 70 family protein [Metabacillus malikii]MDQ0233427.1 hypothetical protein [Metabacillus malikii]